MRVKRALGIVAGVVGKLTAFLVALLVIMRWLGESSLSLLQVIGILGVVYGLVGGIQVRGWLQVGAAAFIVPFLVFGWIGWRAEYSRILEHLGAQDGLAKVVLAPANVAVAAFLSLCAVLGNLVARVARKVLGQARVAG